MAPQRTSQTPPHLDSESVTSGQTTASQMPMHYYEDQRQQSSTPYSDRLADDEAPPSYTVVDNEGPHANPFDLLPTSTSSLGLHPFKGTSNDKVVYYLDKRLDTDPQFLEQHISELAKEPPRPYVRIQGLDRKGSKDGVDFDIHIELTPLLYQEMATRRSWRRILAVNNFDKVRRGTASMTRAPGFGGSGPPEEGTPDVAQWCYRYCANKAGLKVFVLERRLTGWDFALVGSRLESLVRGTGYRGEVNITFPTTNARVEIYNRCLTNRWRLTRWIVLLFSFTFLWMFTWPWVSLRTKWYETVLRAAMMTEAEMSSSSRRILAVALENETAVLSKLVKDLTGSAPESPDPSLGLAGTTHNLALKTPYYSTTVPIWLDLIASPSEWSESFLSPEAAEVLAVLGGVVVVFTAGPISSSKDHPAKELVEHIGKVLKKGLGGWEWDGVGLAIGVGGEGNEEEWDEICAEAGLEFVSLGGKGDTGRNEFGEKTGVARVKEALEANDWSQLEAPLSDSEFGDFETSSTKADEDDKELDPQKMGFGFDRSDFEGLRRAIWEASQDAEEPSESNKAETSKDGASGGTGLEELDEDEIAKIEKMMRKLQAVREAGEGMGEEQRKRMAARAVEEVMRDL
ncbi:Increased recombination centers 6 [Fusarium beomiforme]|uniref:Increased recombination centers 6 n=1 Tax=Fusarium beomiforme TaxID=44412 RepID=A0A9P5ADL6_9HYPO|nr:Increased recombination centers 6 [Fusarium beomiforme]